MNEHVNLIGNEMDNRKLRWSRRLATVPRWSVVPTLKPQNDAEHCYHVAQITRWLVTKYHRQGTDERFVSLCVMYALDHDIREAAEGDSPSPSKPFNTPTVPHRAVVKCADVIEAILHMHQEALMGNGYNAHPVLTELRERFRRVWENFDSVHRVEPYEVVSDVIRACYPSDGSPVHPGMEQ